MKHILSLAILLATKLAFAQVPAIQWQKSYGGNSNETANSIVQTSDGGYIMAGYTNSTNGDIHSNQGNNDYWVVKTDALGTIEWQKTYGGTFDDQANSIIQTTDGGYIIAGFSDSNNGDITNFHGDKDYWIVKIDSTGTIEWQKKYGGDDKESAYEIKQTVDGGYIVAGQTYSYDGVIRAVNGDVTNFHGGIDGWLVKLSNTGVIEWEKCFGNTEIDNFMTITQTADGGYIAAGEHAYYGYWVVKCNNMGNIEWEYLDTDGDIVHSIKQTTDGGYILTGDTVTRIGNATGHNFGVTKLNNFGELEWKKSFGGDGFFDVPRSLQLTPDGGFIIAGVTNSNWSGNVGPSNGAQDMWVIKLSGNGTLQWQKCLGGTTYDGANEIQVTSDNGYIIAGFSQSNNGNVTGNHGGTDFWIVKLMPDAILETKDISSHTNVVHFYPNPAKDKISFNQSITNVVLYSIIGTTIFETNNIKELNISHFKRGNYILKITTNGETFYKKLIKE